MNIFLSIFFFIALIFEIVFKVVLNISTESNVYKFFDLIANILYSYVVSYIFYLIAVIPNYKNTKTVKTILLQRSKKICSSYESFLKDIKQHPIIKNISFDDKKQWNQALNNIRLSDNIPNTLITSGNTLIPKTYYHSMILFRDSILNTVNDIKETAAVMDQKLYLILNKIETASIFSIIKSAENVMTITNNNTITMNILSNSFESASEIFSELEEYISKNLPKKEK